MVLSQGTSGMSLRVTQQFGSSDPRASRRKGYRLCASGTSQAAEFTAKKACRVNWPSPKLRREIGIRRALPYRSAIEPPSLTRKCLRQLGFSAVPKMAERVWSGADWSGRRDSNPRPQPWQGCALPLSYARAPDQGAVSRRLPPRLQAARRRGMVRVRAPPALVSRGRHNIYAPTESKVRRSWTS